MRMPVEFEKPINEKLTNLHIFWLENSTPSNQETGVKSKQKRNWTSPDTQKVFNQMLNETLKYFMLFPDEIGTSAMYALFNHFRLHFATNLGLIEAYATMANRYYPYVVANMKNFPTFEIEPEKLVF